MEPGGNPTGTAPMRSIGNALPWICVVAAVAAPFVVKGFVTFQLTMMLAYAIAILGLNLLTGCNGQVSLGHGAFYAIGAYTAAILVEHGGVLYLWTLPAAAIICFVAGFLFGLPALRLEPIYLALATFALAIATPQVLKLSPLAPWTGGVQGIVMTKPEAPAGLPVNQDQWLYLVTLAVALLMLMLARNLIRSRSGRAMMAVRDNPIAATAAGINTSLYKAATFGISALYAGVAGALGAIAVQFVAPDSFTLTLSIGILVGLVVGGVGWLPGCFIGGMFLVFVPNIAEQISKGLSGAVYGLILLLLMYVFPNGAGGLYQRLIRPENGQRRDDQSRQ